MVDSIVFRIEGLAQHQALVDFLHKNSGEGKTRYTKHFQEGVALEDLEKRSYHHTYFVDHKEGKSWENNYRGVLPSYTYDINYQILWQQDCIEFNFSIPKYLYSTNTFQFVPHYFDAGYFETRHADFWELGPTTYDRLIRFLRWFISYELGGLVEERAFRIMRVDICYNKFFNSKDDALTYLAELKRVKKKFMRETSSQSSTYYGGIYFPSTEYTFKVYHKGCEFRVHDKSKLKKFGYSKSEIELVQEKADRILRYELEFRSGFMNKIFKKYVFRRDSDYWPKAVKYYQGISKNGYVRIDGTKHALEDLTTWQKRVYYYGKEFFEKRFSFYLDAENQANDFDDECYMLERNKFDFPREQKFTKLLFVKMVAVFRVFYREFNITYTNDVSNLLKKVTEVAIGPVEFNNLLRDSVARALGYYPDWVKKIKYKKFLDCVRWLRFHTWAEIKKEGFLGERNFYYYKKAFAAFDIGDASGVQVIPISESNFIEYYNEVDKHFMVEPFRRTLIVKF